MVKKSDTVSAVLKCSQNNVDFTDESGLELTNGGNKLTISQSMLYGIIFSNTVLKLDGTEISVSNRRVTNVAVPTQAGDAANKQYVDSAVAGAGGVKIETGSYTGTGTYGEANPNTLTFSGVPKLIVIQPKDDVTIVNYRSWSNSVILIYGAGSANLGSTRIINFIWNNNQVSWYSDNDEGQLNISGTTYQYLALI